MPIPRNSASTPWIAGSVRSNDDVLDAGVGVATGAGEGNLGAATAGGALGGGLGATGVAADELRPSRPPKSERPDLPFDTGAGPCPRVEENGVAFVSLLAFFSRSCIFFKNVFASFSSANDSAAGHSSSSKVWKNTRSWL